MRPARGTSAATPYTWGHGAGRCAGEDGVLAQLLVLSSTHGGGPVLPSLELLSHRVRQIPAEPAQLVNAPSADIIFVDARVDLVGAKSLCKILNTTGLDAPLLLVVTEGGLTAVSPDWGVDDVILVTAGPAEVDARVRLAIGRQSAEAGLHPHPDVRHHDRRVVLLGEGARQAARPDLQGVPAPALLRHAPVAGVHPRAAAERGVGLRLLRRHAHGRRARATPAREARRPRAADRHRAQRRLPLQRLRGRPAARSARTPTPERRSSPARHVSLQ